MNERTVFIGNDNRLSRVLLPDGINKLAGNAFKDNGTLSSLVIPMGVAKGGDEYKSLPKMTIPATVTDMGDGAFYSYGSLPKLTIPISVR